MGMAHDEKIKQLESLLAYCISKIDESDSPSIWEQDCKALEAAIEALQAEHCPATSPATCPPCDICGGGKNLYQTTATTKLFMDRLGDRRTLVVECMACPPYAKCSRNGRAIASAFLLDYCPCCGRPLTPAARKEFERKVKGELEQDGPL